jgi:gliding motility-associated-like protein
VSYAIEITDANGCTASDIVSITIAPEENIYVPTVFSPNGDGINEVLSVFATDDIHNIISFKIYSRWGELVNEQHDLQPNDVNKGWDGRMRGEEMNPGVYVWIMEVEKEDGERKQITGDVTLIK